MTYQSIVIITPRLCAQFCKSTYFIHCWFWAQVKIGFLCSSFHFMESCFDGCISQRARYDTFRPTPAWI